MSKSGTGNTGSNNDDVGVAVDGSTFSVGSCRAAETIPPRRGIGSPASAILPRREEEREGNDEGKESGEDPAEGAVIHHRFVVGENGKSRQPQGRSPRRRRRKKNWL